MTASDAELVASWRARFSEPVSGWSFDHLADAITSDRQPWSYDDLARTALRDASAVLDLGTGGGEVLLRLRDALPAGTVATEGWPPNLPVARAALAPHGIEVVPYDAEGLDPTLPFPDARFDVVLARHEAYRAVEVARVLRPGGTFLTQQVDGRDLAEVPRLLGGGETAYVHVTLPQFRAEAERAGLVVEEARDWQGWQRFADVATLVSYLRMVPWEVPADFTVDSYADRLLALHHSGRELRFTQRRFLLRCVRE